MRVVLAEDGSIQREALQGLVADAGLVVVGEGSRWPAITELVSARTPDLLIVAVGDDPAFIDGLSAVARIIPTLVLTRALPAPAADQIAAAGAFAVVPLDAGADAVHAAAVVAELRGKDLHGARAEAAELKDQLETRKLVERAKGILMRRLGLSEPDAFRRLQKASQDENKRMRDIAEAIVHAEKVFGGRGEKAPVIATEQRHAQ